MRRGLQLLIAAVAVAASSCAHGRRAADSRQVLAGLDPITVNVVNNYQSAMEIYAIVGKTTYRVGTVAPGIPRSFELRLATLASGGHLVLLAQASGAGPRYQSDDLFLSPGNTVDFEIETNLIGSHANVRP